MDMRCIATKASWFHFMIAALGYILIATSLVFFIIAIFALFTEHSNLAIRSATTAIVMLIFGMILVLLARIHLKRGSKTSAVQVVISTIPAEDLTNLRSLHFRIRHHALHCYER